MRRAGVVPCALISSGGALAIASPWLPWLTAGTLPIRKGSAVSSSLFDLAKISPEYFAILPGGARPWTFVALGAALIFVGITFLMRRSLALTTVSIVLAAAVGGLGAYAAGYAQVAGAFVGAGGAKDIHLGVGTWVLFVGSGMSLTGGLIGTRGEARSDHLDSPESRDA